MTDRALVEDLQKQNPGSPLVHLFELQISDSSSVYFHAGLDDDLTSLQFRDYDTNSTIRTYTAIPVQAEGFELTMNGPTARPTVSFANATAVFSSAVGDYDDLIGKKVVRRTTLKKYLYGESGDSSPPVEYPRQLFFIDRINQKTKQVVSFELVSAFDLEGIRIPARQVVANGCPWIYTGADSALNEYEKVGGCTWSKEGKFKASYKSILTGTTEYIALVNIDDEYIVPGSGESGAVTFSAYSSGGITQNHYKSTTTTLGTSSGVRRQNKDGGIDTGADSSTVTNFWQVNSTQSSPGTLNDDNPYVNRIRIWKTWSNSTTYYAYTDDRFNDYVRYTSGGVTRLWKAKKTNLNQAPDFNEYWELGDLCGKTLKSCKQRYGWDPLSVGTATTTAKANPDTTAVLMFGGFPGARSFK